MLDSVDIMSDFRDNIQKMENLLIFVDLFELLNLVCQNLRTFPELTETEQIIHHSIHDFIRLLNHYHRHHLSVWRRRRRVDRPFSAVPTSIISTGG